MGTTNSKEKKFKLVRPGDPRVPCFAILGRDYSDLQLVNLEGGSSSSVKISDHRALSVVTIIGEVFAVTEKEILKIRSDGTTEQLSLLPELDVYSRVVLFRKKIFIIRPDGKSMLCFDPVDNSLIDDLPDCGLGFGFCASATDKFICAMGGEGTEIKSMKFDPLKLKWKKKARMRKTRFGSAAATLGGKICVMGGNGMTRFYRRTSAEYYNPRNNSWTEISNMNAGRSFFSACVDGYRLYAVGGDRKGENGFYQQSIEVYDKKKWTVVTKFQTKYLRTHACIWPHGSHQPDSKDLTEPLENTYSLLKSEDLLEAKRKVGSKEEREKAHLGQGDRERFEQNSKDLTEPLENTYSLLKSEDLLEAKRKVGSKEEREKAHLGQGDRERFEQNSKDLTEPLENTYSLLKGEDLLEAKRKVGSKEEKFDYPGLKYNLTEGILKEEKEVILSARVGVNQKEGMPDITPTFECNPPLTFKKPVTITMRTSISAPAGKKIPASLLTRDHPGDKWKETQQLSVGQKNEVNFEVDRLSGIKVAAECSGVTFHSYNGFYINLETGKTAVTFSKDQAVHNLVEKSFRKIGYVDFDVITHEILAKFGSEISVAMELKKPEDLTISEALPSPTFTLNEDYLRIGKRIMYFALDPEPSNQCRPISMEYRYKVNGEPEGRLPLTTRTDTNRGDSDNKFRASTLNNFVADKETRSGGNNYNNCSFNTTANQVAIGGDGNMFKTKNIAGDASTVVNAPVGQLATGNANITNQGSGNNYVAGSHKKTGRSVATRKAIYGSFASSSVDP